MNGKVLLIAFSLLLFGVVKNYWSLPRSMFEADQEYLTLSGREILKGNFTLLGAKTSVGGMFIGPLYTYVVAAFLWIFHGNPLVVNGLSDFWAAITIPALYLVGRKLYSQRVGLFAAALALLSTNFIDQAEVPPLLSPFPLLSLLFLWILKSSYSKKVKSVILGVLTGLSLNLHFSGFFFVPMLAITGWLWILPLLLFLSPLVLFDLRNNFFIAHHFIQFLTSNAGSGSPLLFRIDTYALAILNLFYPVKNTLTLARGVLLASLLWTIKKKDYWSASLLIIPLVFFVFYPGLLLPYYSIIAWPVVFLICGQVLSRWPRAVIILFLVAYAIPNAERWATWESIRGIDKKIAALRFIAQESKGNPLYLSKTIEPAADFGFTYLTDYIGVRSTGNLRDPNYTLVIPWNWQEIQPDYRFGDIGVMLPTSNSPNFP